MVVYRAKDRVYDSFALILDGVEDESLKFGWRGWWMWEDCMIHPGAHQSGWCPHRVRIRRQKGRNSEICGAFHDDTGCFDMNLSDNWHV